VGACTVHIVDAVGTAEAEGGQALAAVSGVDGLVFNRFILEVLIVLAVFVGDGADFFRRLRSEIAVGSRVSEDDLLAGVNADFALEKDEIFSRVFCAAMRVCCCD
jgi:hypothetical protein